MDRKVAIGLDLGGTNIKFGLVDDNGSFLFEGLIPSLGNVSSEAVLGQLLAAASTCNLEAERLGMKPVGIGVGSPGIVDPSERVVIGGAENIEGWQMVPVADFLESKLGMPVRVCNDANLMGLGEAAFGAAQGCSDVLFLTVGTGIGGAVIIGGKLFGGFRNRGTELGHIPLIANGEQCACGSVGCLETYASTAALVRQYKDKAFSGLSGENVDGKMIVALYQRGDHLATEVMNNHFYYLGRGIAGLINIFSPERIVIGGGISEAGEFYLDKVSEMAFKHAMPECSENTRIVVAQLGNKAGCLGAAQLMLADA